MSTLLPWHQSLFEQWHRHPRTAHAHLIIAPDHTGGEQLLHTLAHSILCEKPQSNRTPCMQCAGCDLITANSHPDLKIMRPTLWDVAHEVEEFRPEKPSKYITIDQVRELANMVNQTSHRGGQRVVLVYPAHKLNLNAANALLKTLEEPPANTQFFLLSHDVKQLLPTIISRCQRVHAPAPDTAMALDYLNQTIGPQADWAAQLQTEGNAVLRVAALHDSDYFSQQSQCIQELAKGKQANALKLAEDLDKAIKASDKARLAGEVHTLDMSVVITWLQRWAHDWVLMAQGVESPRFFTSHQKALHALAQNVRLDKLHAWQQDLLQEQRSSDHPLNTRVWLEKLLLQYTQI